MSCRWTEQHWPFTVHAESWTDYEKVTMVRVELHVNGKEVLHARASAVCHPDDTWDTMAGRAIAYRRALLKCLKKVANSTKEFVNKSKKEMYRGMAP